MATTKRRTRSAVAKKSTRRKARSDKGTLRPLTAAIKSMRDSANKILETETDREDIDAANDILELADDLETRDQRHSLPLDPSREK